ncbi:MAG: hypothetical protein AAFR31_04790 [Cyanobacteria bacterium J06627_8]
MAPSGETNLTLASSKNMKEARQSIVVLNIEQSGDRPYALLTNGLQTVDDDV